MPCYSPLTGWLARRVNPSGKRSIVFKKSEGFADKPLSVPCNQCTGCRLEHSRVWAVRCMHEAQMHEENCFITLTYNDEKLPKYNNLEKKQLQKFIKRLRRKYGEGIKYYACGEYGDERKRPHYHACIFGMDFEDKEIFKVENGNRLYTSKTLNKLWSDPLDKKPFGFATVGEFTFETAAYVARYCMKKTKGKNWQEDYEIILPNGEIFQMQHEFALMSRRPAIAKEWFEKYKKEVFPSDSVVVNGVLSKPPRYYDKLQNNIDETLLTEVKDNRKKAYTEHEFDNSLARLFVRGKVKDQQIKLLKRSIE